MASSTQRTKFNFLNGVSHPLDEIDFVYAHGESGWNINDSLIDDERDDMRPYSFDIELPGREKNLKGFIEAQIG